MTLRDKRAQQGLEACLKGMRKEDGITLPSLIGVVVVALHQDQENDRGGVTISKASTLSADQESEALEMARGVVIGDA